jgi:superfamily II DNA or RNA helicase
MTGRRYFNSRERGALYLAADGHCTECGAELEPGWHADHVDPHSAGGPTDVINGQALCPPCNLKKGARMDELRPWQRQAIEDFYAARKADFLVTATPGAGKTTFALSLAKRLLDERTVTRVAVIAPTDALRKQWADEAAKFGVALMPVSAPVDYTKAGYQGCVATYAQVMKGLGAEMLRQSMRTPTLVILDEIHHAGDNRAWGEGLTYAVDQATLRLALTGTPWRRDPASPIPFVTYDEYGRVKADHAYEYGDAVADGVCRRIEFHAYDGDAKWIDCGKVSEASLGAARGDEDVAAALKAAYNPSYHWMPALLRKANEALRELREEIPDAGGLVVADTQQFAVAYADILAQIVSERPIVAVSDGTLADFEAIDTFKAGRQPWIVAVRQVSEGVDIPRLAVGVYASTYRTPLFFRQVVGRFVRTRPGEELNGRLFIPAIDALMDHAREIEDELRHQLEIEVQRDEATRGEFGDDYQPTLNLRESLSATEAEFDRAILAGDETSPEDYATAQQQCREFGIPTHLALNVARLVRAQQATAPQPVRPAPVAVTPQHRREKMLRQEVETLARKLAYRAGIPPKQVNIDLRKAGHPARKTATIAELEAIQRTLAKWIGDL